MAETNNKSQSWPRVVLFDLDGTLIDSAPDLATATNKVLAESAMEPLSVNEVRSMIGHGVAKLVQRAFRARGLALEKPALTPFVDRMMDFYMQGLTDETELLPHAREIVAHYKAQGVKTGVVTNKPYKATMGILAYFGLDTELDVVVGGDQVENKKPSPDIVQLALTRLEAAPSDALLVGDSAADVGAAKAAGVPVLVVMGGYTDNPAAELGADGEVESLADVPKGADRLRANTAA